MSRLMGGRGLACAITVAIGAAAPAWAGGTMIERVSVGSGGVQANGLSTNSSISPDGNFVAFTSSATNLVPGDTNDTNDVFVHDRKTGTTVRVSVGPGGTEANGSSFRPSISKGGRFVAFVSAATNLVPGDTNDTDDVFVRDRKAGTTRRVSVGPDGIEADGLSRRPAISADGRFVAFGSFATNLVPGDTNDNEDVFVHDLKAGMTRRVSVGPGGAEADGGNPAISANGRFVAFMSGATNLVPGDTNEATDIFVHDRKTGAIRRVSLGLGGIQSDADSFLPAISANGRFVAFFSPATNLVPGDTNDTDDVFVHDRKAGTTWRVSVGPGGTEANGSSLGPPALSANGRFVAFRSFATNLVPDDTNDLEDAFVHDRKTGTTVRVSVGPGGMQGDRGGSLPTLSADGRFVAFESSSTNLVPGDTNDLLDVFVRILHRRAG